MQCTCTIDKALPEIFKLDRETIYDIEIKKHRNKRSLNANAYLWVLLEQIAKVLHSSKDEIYIQMLDRYGVFTHIVVKENAVERVMNEWRTARNLGRVIVNGQTGTQLQCYYGSSTYDTKEMARLLNGVVSECKELGIPTKEDLEIKEMLKEWNR